MRRIVRQEYEKVSLNDSDRLKDQLTNRQTERQKTDCFVLFTYKLLFFFCSVLFCSSQVFFVLFCIFSTQRENDYPTFLCLSDSYTSLISYSTQLTYNKRTTILHFHIFLSFFSFFLFFPLLFKNKKVIEKN